MAIASELGRLCLCHSYAELQLTLDAVVTSSSAQLFTGQGSSTVVPTPLTPGSAWVCRGSGFHLALDISANGHPLDSHLQRHLASSIRNADYWDQLNLRATCTEGHVSNEDHTTTPEERIVIQLAHSDLEAPLSSRHRLPTVASVSDVQPPQGVDVVRLESVQLTVDISTCEGKKRNTLRQSKRLQMRGSSSAPVPSHEEGGPAEDDHRLLVTPEEVMLLDDSQGMVADATLPTRDELLHPNPSRVLERIDSGTAFADDLPRKGGAGFRQHIAELVDSAIRLTICGKPLKLPSGIKVTRDEVTKLAAVAPALWRPNHLKAVSERAPFLPTIAHALSHSLLANARSASLKRKAAELLVRHPPVASRAGPPSPTDTRQNQGPNFVYEATSIGLWNLFQRGGFDSGARKRLNPPKTQPSNVDATEIDENNEMLHDSSGGWEKEFDAHADDEDSPNAHYIFQDDFSNNDMLWDCSIEYDEPDLETSWEAPVTLVKNSELSSHTNNTEDEMLLDLEDTVSLDGGKLLGAQGPPARSNPSISSAIDGDFQGNSSSFEAFDLSRLVVPGDAYKRVDAEPEMLFDDDLWMGEN